MDRKMTTNLFYVLLGGLTATAVAFPSPEKAIQSAKSLFEGEPVEVVEKPNHVEIKSPALPRFVSMQTKPTDRCLNDDRERDLIALQNCAYRISYQIENLPQNLTYAGDYEAQRLALAKLCRTLWTIENGMWTDQSERFCGSRFSALEND